MKNDVRQAPRWLSKSAKSLWKAVASAYFLESGDYEILSVACEALDRRNEARAVLAKSGLSYTDQRGVVRARPEVRIEADAANRLLRALRQLDLDPALALNEGRK